MMTASQKGVLQDFLKDEGIACVDDCIRFSRDYHWFSPKMEAQYETAACDVGIEVRTVEELRRVVQFCAASGIAMIVRGAATGNLGQIIPLEGGLMIDITQLDDIVRWSEASVTVLPGVKCQRLENAARERGLEMFCYPSTWMKATIGGFALGGSGGIGGMSHGLLHQNKMIQRLNLLTAEPEPRPVTLSGDEVLPMLHSFGAVGIATELEVALAPKRDWVQLAFTHVELDTILPASVELLHDWDVELRMMGFLSHPLPQYCLPMKRYFPEPEHLLVMEAEVGSETPVVALAQRHGLRIAHRIAPHEPRKPPMMSDFVQGHSILWAKKADRQLTPFSIFLNPSDWREQLAQVREIFREDFSLQIDFHRHRGQRQLKVPVWRQL